MAGSRAIKEVTIWVIVREATVNILSMVALEVSIQVTSKLSGTYNSALQGRELAGVRCRVEVVDSLSTSMGYLQTSTATAISIL